MSLPEKNGFVQQQNQLSTQRKQTPTNPKKMRKNVAVKLVHARSNKGQKTDGNLVNQKAVPVAEIDLETPEQTIDET